MGWSGGVLKGSCAAFGEEGRGLEEEPRNPIASSWILTPITDLGNRKGCEEREREVEVVVEGGGGGGILTLEAVFTQDIHCVQQCDPPITKYCFIL